AQVVEHARTQVGGDAPHRGDGVVDSCHRLLQEFLQLGQSLTAVKMDLARMLRRELQPELEEFLEEAVATIDNSISTVRRIASDLRPRMLDDLGLPDAVEWYAESFARRSELEVSCSVTCLGLKVDPKTSIALFRILQESLTNVLRHACARSVVISLSCSGGMLTLSIADDGQGFRMEEARKKHTLGVLGLKERTLTLGGSFCVSTAPGAGTRIQVQVPII
ncbi:MAG: sensor histidine kinase, partial [Chitinophagaceae bacterium]